MKVLKSIGEFVLTGILLMIVLLLVLKEMGNNNWEAEHCRWDKNMEYQCDKR